MDPTSPPPPPPPPAPAPPPPPPPPPAVDVVEPATVTAPGKGAVFGQLLWRSIVLAIVGGAVIGAIVILVVAVIDDETGYSDIGVAAYVGAWVGLLLGLLAGLVLGIVGAIMLVPYRGKRRTIGVVRVAAIISVTGFFLMLFSMALDKWWAWMMIALALVGTAVLSPWLVGWYVKRMGDT